MSMVAKGMQTGRGPAGPGGLRWRLARLEDENAALREEQQRLEREQQRLEAERERLRGENQRLRAERERLQEVNERLRGEVEALRRAAKRQAAPFSKGDPTPHPKRPGRKPGAAYGTRAYRRAPAHVDQVVTVGLPACRPSCGGELALERMAVQYQEELPPARPLVTRFQVRVGRCRVCGRRVQPRPPPRRPPTRSARREPSLVPGRWRWRPGSARGWACRPARSRRCWASSASRSLPWGRPGGAKGRPPGAAHLPGVGRGRAGQSRGRARRDRLAGRWRKSMAVGLRRGAGHRLPDHPRPRLRRRGGDPRRGLRRRAGTRRLAPYRRFEHATHQSCLAHLLRRCRELVSDAVAGQAKTPHAVRRIHNY